MRLYPTLSTVVLMLMIRVPAHSTSKEGIVLQTQVQGLQNQLARLTRTLDQNMGLLTYVINQNAESTLNLDRKLRELSSRLQSQKSVDQELIRNLTSEVNVLNAAINDFKQRAQTLTLPPGTQATATVSSSSMAPQATATETQPAGKVSSPTQQSLAQSESTQLVQTGNLELYESAMEHYRSKEFEIAANEFTNYLKTDWQTETALNAQFYLAEIEFEEKDFEGALEDYTGIVTRLTDPSKAPTARYKKALCLLELERKDEAILALRTVIERYPASAEAARAARKLRTLEAPNGKPPLP